MNMTISTMVALAYLLLIPFRVVAQESIVLRTSCRVGAGAELTLGDVAELNGAGASKLAGVKIVTSRSGKASERVVGIADVRTAVEAQAPALGVNLGAISISGASCRVLDGQASTVPVVGLAERRAPEAVNAAMAQTHTGPQTIRAMVLAKVIEAAGVAAEDVRVAFEPRHAALLDKSTSGRVVSVDSSGGGEKLSYAVRIYEQNMLVAQEDVRVGVTVRRNVAVARASFARGDAIDAADITIQDEWLPLTKRPAAADVVAGSVAKGRINVGDVIDARNIEDPLAIRPGDQIVVDCISGALVVRTHAVAKEAGRQGEVIAAETVEWKQGILVKVSKAGHGVSMGPVDLKKRRSQSKSQRS